MTSKAPTVAAYLKELPPDKRSVMQALRKLVKKVAPKAKEEMLYGMPAFSVEGKPFVGMNSQKNYFALYVCYTDAVIKRHEALARLNCGKGCIRFRKLDDLPLEVAEDVLRDALRDCLRGDDKQK